MQPLTAAPRDTLTTAQVTSLLTGPSLSVSAGLELLDANRNVVSDISDDLAGGTVERHMGNKIHGTCRLRLSRSLTWGVDLVRPYMTLADAGVTARWNLGVFALTTPERRIGETPATYDVAGFDRIMLLDRQVGATYTVAAGTTYRAAILQAFADAGLSGVTIEGAAADNTLPAAKTWPLVGDSTDPDQTTTPVTWLRVVNDLLRAINFRGVWADENGAFRCELYRDPASRAPEFTFDADDVNTTIVGAERDVVEDVWRTPNRWVFRQTNRAAGAPTPTEGDGIYTVNNLADGITSQNSRGLVWTSVIDYEAANQAKLVELGNRRVSLDKGVTRTYEVTTGPFPPAGHADIYDYRDFAIGSSKVHAYSWALPLDGSDMRWLWQKAA